jgi:hypothetical protein
MHEIDKEILIAAGYHLRGGALVEQAQTTRTIALADIARFKEEGLLGDDDLTALDSLVAEVHKGLGDRTLATSDAHTHTAGQGDAVRDLKVRRRRLMRCAERAFRTKTELNDFRQSTHQGSSVPSLCTDLRKKIAFARKHAATFAKVGVSEQFVANLEASVSALEQSDATQEAALARLPNSTRAFCEAKGRLYFLVKDINDAGHALHADDLEAAAKYNLKLLYRRGTPRGTQSLQEGKAQEIKAQEAKAKTPETAK